MVRYSGWSQDGLANDDATVMSEPEYPLNTATSPTSQYNSLRFVIDMAMQAKMTCTIVKVVKVTTKGEVAPIGRVNVLPLVQMIDGIGRTVDPTTVFGLPYFRLAGGKKAVIMDPKAGDIGIVVVADRDISGVKKTKKMAPPGSRRWKNLADGIYISTVLGETPETYIRFTDDDKIIGAVGKSDPCEFVVASDHVQLKKKGNPDLHVTIDAASGKIILGMTPEIGPDPFPND